MEGSTVVTDSAPALEETEVSPTMETGPGSAECTGNNGSGEVDGGEASSPWSLTNKQQVYNLKENWKRFLIWTNVDNSSRADRTRLDKLFKTNTWFAPAVTNLRVAPCLDGYDELEILAAHFSRDVVSWFKMTSLDVAILMGDLKMVQEILQTSSNPLKLVQGSPVDQERVVRRFFQANSPKKTVILYTPLHLAVASGDIHIIDALLEKGADINAKNWLHQMPLDYACKIKSVDLLQKLLEKDKKGRDPFHIAVRNGDIDFMKKLPSQNVNAMDKKKRTPLHYLAAYPHHNVSALRNILQYLAKDKKLDMKALDEDDLSAFYVAILCCNTQFVIALLESFKDKIRLNEVCNKDFGPPIQIAFERGHRYKDIEVALMECDLVKSFMERLYRDRQVYVDAANAILVGAALIASVTFASWLQPPLNYTSYSGEIFPSSSSSNLNYVDVVHNTPLRVFGVFNAFSFYFAIATVVCGA